MNDFAKLFDSILGLLVSYPVTIFRVLLSPHEVFAGAEGSLVSSPGGTFAVSFLVFYVAHSTQLRIQFADIKLPEAPSKSFFVRTTVLVSLFVLAQYAVLSMSLFWPAPPNDPLATVKALTYPVSVSMCMYTVAYLIWIVLPSRSRVGRFTIVEKLDLVSRNLARENRKARNVVAENANDIATFVGIGTYVWALYNVCSYLFKFDIGPAIYATALVSVLSLVLLYVMIFLFFRHESVIESLRKKEVVPGATEIHAATQGEQRKDRRGT